MMNTHHLDATRLLCPMPVIKVQNTIATLETGDKLIVTCTDPGVKHDIPAWCRVHGHSIDKIAENAEEIVLTLVVGEKN